MATHTGHLTLGISHNLAEQRREADRMPLLLDRALMRGTIDAAEEYEGDIRRTAPGRIAQGWGRRVYPTSVGARVVVYKDDMITYWYSEGTKAHPIVARNAKALRFRYMGRLMFRKSVKHPGTKPHPFMQESGARARPAMERAYINAVREVTG